jgi:hypothetical protein
MSANTTSEFYITGHFHPPVWYSALLEDDGKKSSLDKQQELMVASATVGRGWDVYPILYREDFITEQELLYVGEALFLENSVLVNLEDASPTIIRELVELSCSYLSPQHAHPTYRDVCGLLVHEGCVKMCCELGVEVKTVWAQYCYDDHWAEISRPVNARFSLVGQPVYGLPFMPPLLSASPYAFDFGFKVYTTSNGLSLASPSLHLLWFCRLSTTVPNVICTQVWYRRYGRISCQQSKKWVGLLLKTVQVKACLERGNPQRSTGQRKIFQKTPNNSSNILLWTLVPTVSRQG